jgi:hypothetical protein
VPISYPIAIDTEHVSANARANNLTRAQRTSAIKGFCERIKKLGYTPMIYASTSWLNNDLDMSKLPYDVWCAQYYSECQYKGKYIIWQYTSEGRVNGVSGVVDMNRCYIKPKTVNPPKPSPSGKPYTGAYPIIDRRKLIVDMAVKLAWAKGTPTKTYTFPNGRATKAFQNALDTAYPEHNKWGAAARVGASCDVFLGTVVRAVQIDSKFPRGLEQQFDYAPKWADRFVYKGIAPANKSQDGDIVLFSYDGGGHAIIRGNGVYYEANYPTYFGHTNPSLARLRRKQNDTIVLRPKNYLAKGDTGAEVKKLQRYMIWGGWLAKGGDDSAFGAKTETAVKNMQNALNVVADGKVGSDTLQAMRAYRK